MDIERMRTRYIWNETNLNIIRKVNWREITFGGFFRLQKCLQNNVKPQMCHKTYCSKFATCNHEILPVVTRGGMLYQAFENNLLTREECEKMRLRMIDYFVKERRGKNRGFSLKVKEEALKRANYKCEDCGNSIKIQVHHKDGNPRNNELSNAKVLCYKCHVRCGRRVHKRG